jgi:hypothetical protein
MVEREGGTFLSYCFRGVCPRHVCVEQEVADLTGDGHLDVVVACSRPPGSNETRSIMMCVFVRVGVK